MRLPPKPSGKDKRPSRANILTQRIDMAASPTSMRPTRPEPANSDSTVASSPETQPAQAVASPNSKTGPLKNARVIVLAPNESELTGEEKRELSYLGTALAQMSWLRLYTDSLSFREGVTKGQGRIAEAPDSSLDAFDAAFTYRSENPYPTTHHIEMSNYKTLQRIVAEAITRLYKLGIIQ